MRNTLNEYANSAAVKSIAAEVLEAFSSDLANIITSQAVQKEFKRLRIDKYDPDLDMEHYITALQEVQKRINDLAAVFTTESCGDCDDVEYTNTQIENAADDYAEAW